MVKKLIATVFLLASLAVPAYSAVEVDGDANGAVDVDKGGTNATTASSARTNLGLGNVQNTSDANKPVSTAQQTALNLKADKTEAVIAWDSITNGTTVYIGRYVTYNNSIWRCVTQHTDGAGTYPGNSGNQWTLASSAGGGEGGASATNLSASAGSTSVTIASDTGNDATINGASTLVSGVMTATDKTKLDGIAAGATANSPDATLLARANHTGTQTASTISDFASAVSTAMSAIISKVNGIQSGAEVNVNADWNASSGDAQILNKPTVFTVDTDQTITGKKTFEDIVIPPFDDAQFNLQAGDTGCTAGVYSIYFTATGLRKCVNGTASEAGAGGSMTYPASGNFGYTSNGTTWSTMGLDTDLSSTSSNDDTVPSAKAVRTALDGISASSVPSVTETPPDAATGAVWYNSTSNEFCVAESAGISCVAMTYTADDNDPSNSTPWFTDETDIALNTSKISNAITLAGLGARGAAISVTGSTGAGYSKNSAGCTSSAGRVYTNDTIAACVTSSSSSGTATTATVTIGTDSDTYSCTTAAASCSTTLTSFETNSETVSLYSTTSVRGDEFTATSGQQICAIQVYVIGVYGGTRTLYARVGTSDDLTSSYTGGSVTVTSANNGSWVTIPLSSSVSGSTTYYFGVATDAPDYNGRVEFGGAPTDCWVSNAGWDLASSTGATVNYRIMRQ